jgi:hypothetical protein
MMPGLVCRLCYPVLAIFRKFRRPKHLEAEQSIVDALEACGGDVQFTTFPGIGHDLDSSRVYTSDLYAWLLSHTRNTQQE